MKNTILLSINVFNPNRELLKYGIYTAKNLGATLVLFEIQYESVMVPNQYAAPGNAGFQVINNTKRIELAKRKLAELYKEISNEWYFTKAKLVTDAVPTWKGDKEYYLLDEIEEQQPILVIMDIKNDFNFINELFGTRETRLAEAASCPVLLLPENASYSEITAINYLLERNKSIEVIINEISFLRKMSDSFTNKSTINLIYYFGDNKEIAEKEIALKKSILVKNLGHDKLVFLNMSEHEIETAIHQNTKKYAADIFAFPNRNKSFLDRLTNKDNTKRLILQAKIPVLVF